MRSILAVALFFGALLSSALPAHPNTLFHLEGRVPQGLSTAFLTGNYVRIWRAIAPDTAVDRSCITVIYYSRSDERKLGVRLPEWGGGGAIGRDTIIVPTDRFPLADMDIGRVTVHELVHIALERAYGRVRIPRWFHEGLAMTLSGELSFEEQTALSRAVFSKRLLALDSIERVNRFNVSGAMLAYSESHLAVAFMIDKYSIDGIPELLDSVRALGRFDSALYKVFGFTAQEYDRTVQNYIVDKYQFVFLMGDTYLFWVPGALLVVAGFFAIKIRNRRRKREMEEEEKMAKEKNETTLSVDDVLDDFESDTDNK
jgi:hypothetical protein